MIRKIYSTILLLSFFYTQMVAQDPVFSQFYASPLQLNPALTGSAFAPRLVLNYRNQWPSLGNAYVTYAASYDQFLPTIKSGIGISLLADAEGDGIFQTTKANISYAYNTPITRSINISGGAEIGIGQKRVNWDKLIFLDQIDALRGYNDLLITEENRPDNPTATYLDIGVGMLVYTEKFYGGISVKHLNAPDERILADTENAFGSIPLLLSFHAGAEIILQENNKRETVSFISPNIFFAKQGDFYQTNLGVYAAYKMLFGGLWYRQAWSNSDAAIALVGIQKDIFKLGYSYDMTLSALSDYTGGSHEISLILNFGDSANFQRSRSARRYNDCLKMFK